MSRMTNADWAVYSVLRSIKGKAYAEDYKHKRNRKNAEYRIGLRRKEENWKIVKDYGIDGYLAKKFLPGEWSKDELIWFRESEWIEPTYSAYDCTGHAFSSWMSFYTVPNGVWAYHRISIDL